MSIVTLNLAVHIYNNGTDNDYKDIKDCVVNSRSNAGEESLLLTFEHFVDTAFDTRDESSRKECETLAPTLWKSYMEGGFDPCETFLDIHNLRWSHTKSKVVPEGWTAIEHSGLLKYDVSIPEHVDKEVFLAEFNSLFDWYSNRYVGAGWIDMGYVFGPVV